MKKVNVLSLVMFFMTLCCGTTMAKAVEQDTKNDTEKLHKAMEVAKEMKRNEFVHFTTALFPELGDERGRQLMGQLYNATVGTGVSSRAIGDGTILQQLIQMLSAYGLNAARLAEMIQKVYPLYAYQMQNRIEPGMSPTLKDLVVDTLYQTPADELYFGIGDPRNQYNPYGFSRRDIVPAVNEGGKLKYNGAYAWGMTKWGNKLYWSTNNNYLCMQGYGAFAQPGVGDTSYENKCWVCEYEKSTFGKKVYGKDDPELVKFGDIRPPRMFSYNTENGLIQDITPSEDNEDFKILRNCQGLRSAGAHNGVAFFGGPGLYASDLKDAASSAFAAFDADRGKFISASSMSEVDGCAVTNVRRWIVYDDVLYVGTKVITKEGKTRGAILRWYGDKSDPWQFHIVGWVPMDAAEITIFNGKMYVGTWGGAPERQYTSSVCCSETIPAGGLQPVASDAKDWQILWSVSEYEHYNSNGRQITSVAGFKAWRGHLYWGMFAPSFMLLSTASNRYDDLTSPDAISFLLGNHRQTTLWRLDTDNKVELLYGETRLPKWNQQDDTWSFDETGWTPKWGRAGYGNIWCIYTWAMHEYNDKLYLGTMDCSNLIDAVNDNSSGGINIFGMLKTLTNTNDSSYGFEILVMDDEEKAPTFITKDGFGNHDAYGVRNFGVLDNRLFVGTASPFNLAEHGGWRIITIEDKTIATSVEQSKIVEPGIVYKTEAGSITMASVDGEDITSIEIYDVAGKLINKIAPNAHTITFPLDAAGVIVAKITTKSGTWTGKITNQ